MARYTVFVSFLFYFLIDVFAVSIPSSLLPDPTRRECGHVSSERILKTEVDVDEHPWTALLHYRKQTHLRFRCGGFIINNRYVLTAAHCVSVPTADWDLISVRLGEHNIETEQDCDDLYPPYENCADPPIDVLIEEKIVHEEYKLGNMSHDIALLRLVRNLTFSDFVQPICLMPMSEKVNSTRRGQFSEAIGWGVSFDYLENHTRRRTKIQLLANDECKTIYGKLADAIHEDQLCTAVAQGEEFCGVDSGGVLTKKHDTLPVLVAMGIMSSDPFSCTSSDVPLVYTNVLEHIPWIVSKLKP